MFGASVAGILNADAQSDEEARSRVWRLFGSILAALFFMDIGCAFSIVVLQCANEAENDHGGQGFVSDSSTRHCIQTSIVHGFSSHDNLGDFFLLAIGRCAFLSKLLWIGVKYGQRPKPDRNGHESAEGAAATLGEGEEQARLTEPLLTESESSAPAGSLPRESPEGSSWRQKCSSIMQPQRIKHLVLLCLFATCTVYQVYAGVRVANFEDSTAAITPLLCLTVLWINAQAYVFRTLLVEMTREDGIFLPPQIHRHPVYFENGRGLSIHWCDLCHKRIGGERPEERREGSGNNDTEVYRCSLCDFDVCVKCARRNDAATVGENVLRGDRGVRTEASLSTASYFKRSMQVAGQELPLLLVSFLLLAASSLSRLALPHFQGNIIGKVVPDSDGNFDKAGFKHYIQLYIVVMVVQGAVSTLYSAIFTLVSRRLKFNIRNALLEKILAQDVAYFDGTETGHVLSRLTVDLDLMMSPIQSSLSSLLSNILILIGGLVMCFYNSYRLSMIAFVTVGPITYLWEQYAQWSKGLAREMLSYWAEGNGIASQALCNIRTVKAFGCEEHIMKKYKETNKQALDCGVKDAWGNGATSALTGYLDLGSGVLILWFGGMLVYSNDMTISQLITFQLCWDLLNGSYQNLTGLITSFTRSAAGAEKVFTMMDSDPDIDPKAGSDVSWQVEGHLKLQDVSYYYQMRPDHMVLNKINLEVPAGKSLALVGRSGGG